jgi:phosphoribosylformylglycinamidine (FGAM) synthase-like amidotransferase family enzyme
MDAAKVSRIKAPRKDLPQNLWRQDGRDVAVFCGGQYGDLFRCNWTTSDQRKDAFMDAIEGTPKKGYRMLQSRWILLFAKWDEYPA